MKKNRLPVLLAGILLIFAGLDIFPEDRGTTTGAVGAYQQDSCQFGRGKCPGCQDRGCRYTGCASASVGNPDNAGLTYAGEIRIWNENTFTKYDLMDMNGDGLPDRVVQNMDAPGILRIGLNNAGIPSDALLLRINCPQGGRTEYAYQPVNKLNNPGYKFKSWVVRDITIHDGFGKSAKTGYDYFNGVYNRDKREDRGFGMVKTTSPAGDYSITTLFQDDEKAGLVEKEVSYDHDGYIHSYVYNNYTNLETISTHYGYNLTQNRPGLAGTFSQLKVKAVVRTHQWTYTVSGETGIDNGTAPGGTAGTTWKSSLVYSAPVHFDDYGNILHTYTGSYISGWGKDRIHTATEYIYDITSWKFLPRRISSYRYNQSGTECLSSDKRIHYDNQPYGQAGPAGLPTEVETCKDAAVNWVNTRTGYDAYGNVLTATDANGNVTGTTYETRYRSYPLSVTAPAVKGITFTSFTGYDTLMRPVSQTIGPDGTSTFVCKKHYKTVTRDAADHFMITENEPATNNYGV